MTRGYTVYRMNYVTGKKEAIGCILERREKESRKNLLDLVAEARRLFGKGTSESIHIVLDTPHAPLDSTGREQAFTRGIVTVISRYKAAGGMEPEEGAVE